MSERAVPLLLDDICAAAEKATRYIAGMSFDDFSQDEKTIDAVVRNLEIIGEAARQLPEAFRDAHREIEWHKVVGLRNRIVHEYFGVDLEIVWQILHHDLPRLHSSVGDILS